MKNEVWKTVINHPDYKISNLGNIKSFKRKIVRILKPNLHKSGYYVFELDYKQLKRANLIAKHFIENPNNYPIVNHKDGNRSNDLIDNLEWSNQSDNTLHGWYSNNRKGLVKVFMYSKENKFIKEFESVSKAAKEMNINKAHISSCCRKRIKTAGGYIWKYKKITKQLN